MMTNYIISHNFINISVPYGMCHKAPINLTVICTKVKQVLLPDKYLC